LETEAIIENIIAKKVFKNGKIGVKITTITSDAIGYDIINVENPSSVISDIENVLAPNLIGYSTLDQDFIDSIICDNSTEEITTTMGLSISITRAAANSIDMPLFKYVGGALSSEIPILGAPLLTDRTNSFIVIPMAESIGELVFIYDKLLKKMYEQYPIVNELGEHLCSNIFSEKEQFFNIVNTVSEEEDVKISVGAVIDEPNENTPLNNIDYLESQKLVDFDGTFASIGIDENIDFSIIEPYSMGTLTEMYHYVNYILDSGLTPIMLTNNNSFAHVAVGLRMQFIRSNINSTILNELWNIERTLKTPNIGKF